MASAADAEQRRDCGAKFGLHLEVLRNRDRLGAAQGGIEAPLQHGLRPLSKPLPPLLKLLQQPEPGPALGQLAIGFLKPALGLLEFPGQRQKGLLGGRRLSLGARLLGQSLLDRGCDGCDGSGQLLVLAPGLAQLAGKRVVAARGGPPLDLISQIFGAQAGDCAFKLEGLELCLLEILLELAQRPLADGQVAVPLLKDGVGAAEQVELHLLVLRPGVSLHGDFAQLHLDFPEPRPRGGQPVLQTRPLRHSQRCGAFGLLLPGAQIVHGFLGCLDALVQVAAMLLALVKAGLAGLEGRAPRGRRRPQLADFVFESVERRRDFRVLKPAPGQAEVPQTV